LSLGGTLIFLTWAFNGIAEFAGLEFAGSEFAGLENNEHNRRGGICRTGK